VAPINPVGKFLSVKALVFFTWWQSVAISVLYQMDLIPTYQSAASSFFGTNSDIAGSVADTPSEPDWSVPLSAENATALDELGGNAFWPASGAANTGIIEYSPEDVAKAMQDYLICIEMFVAAIVHTFVFPHSEYSPEAVEARARALNQKPNKNWNKRLGRKWRDWDNKSSWSGTTRSSRDSADIELSTMNRQHASQLHPMNRDEQPLRYRKDSADEDDLMNDPLDRLNETEIEHQPLLLEGDNESEGSSYTDEDDDDGDEEGEFAYGDSIDPHHQPHAMQSPARKKNFVSALLDSTIPQDLRDNTVGIIKGDYVVEKKTLLHHAATSDSYDLFSRFPKRKMSLVRASNTAEQDHPRTVDGKIDEIV
jgi:Organic solute transporter Ostalpha